LCKAQKSQSNGTIERENATIKVLIQNQSNANFDWVKYLENIAANTYNWQYWTTGYIRERIQEEYANDDKDILEEAFNILFKNKKVTYLKKYWNKRYINLPIKHGKRGVIKYIVS